MIDVRKCPVRFSELKRIALSPAHYKAACEAGRDVNPKASYLRHGLGVDAILFAVTPYVVWEGERRAGKAWEDFSGTHASSLILSRDEFSRADCAAQAIAHNRDAMRVLDGDRQRRIEWEWLGLPCASTLDIVKPRSHVTELKTAKTAHPDRFKFASMRYCYAEQHRFYGMAAAQAFLGEHEHFTVVSESEAPWCVTVLRYTPRTLTAAERRLRIWMERLKSCIEANEWPGYSQTIVDLDLEEENDLIFDEDEAAQ